jgi:hypothetical protein
VVFVKLFDSKIIILVLLLSVCVLSFGVIGCAPKAEPITYVSEDYSRLLNNGVEYVPFNVPFTMSASGNIYGEKCPTYLNKTYLSGELMFYKAAKIYPWLTRENVRHDLYDVIVGGMSVKFVVNPDGMCFSYCLAEDKAALETIMNEISWLGEKVGISSNKTSTDEVFIQEMNSELAAFILDAEEQLRIIASKSDTIVIDEKIDNKLNLMLYRCDDSCNLGYNIFEIIAVEDGYFLYNGFYVKGVGGAYKEPTCDIADDLSFLVIPEEYKSVIESFVK